MLINIEISSVLQGMVRVSAADPERDQWDLPSGSCVKDILDALSFGTVPILLVVNGEAVGEEAQLTEGDTLKLLPIISGG